MGTIMSNDEEGSDRKTQTNPYQRIQIGNAKRKANETKEYGGSMQEDSQC
ncbi:hypothetical protein LPTSP4_12330 [Leptospira ryugenii]|uniref:Uncharacterized protein n=1 Tax=Leptospira ryugenii TaxID=1917863 RepID=A0A2P2DYL0_9LEPT|nr:hypothetical protein LPTSP4_12330 [Leptospira ryugenii]